MSLISPYLIIMDPTPLSTLSFSSRKQLKLLRVRRRKWLFFQRSTRVWFINEVTNVDIFDENFREKKEKLADFLSLARNVR